jgi:Putative zinc-finger
MHARRRNPARRKTMDILKIACDEVRQELANYIEDDVPAELRRRIENHFLTCDGCYAIYDGLRKIVRLVGGNDVIELPAGFSRRLYQRIVGVRQA